MISPAYLVTFGHNSISLIYIILEILDNSPEVGYFIVIPVHIDSSIPRKFFNHHMVFLFKYYQDNIILVTGNVDNVDKFVSRIKVRRVGFL